MATQDETSTQPVRRTPSCNQMRFTRLRVEQIPLPLKGQQFYWDTDLPGFGIRVTPGSKAFIVERKVNRKTCRLTLGQQSILDLDLARQEAMTRLLAMSKGLDPRELLKAETLRGLTLEETFDTYLSDHVLKPSTEYDYKMVFAWGLLPWKTRSMTSITKDEVIERHKALSKKSKARANLAMRLLRALFNFAMAKYDDTLGNPIITINPVLVLSRLKLWHRIKRRRTVIEVGELPGWIRAVCDLTNSDPKWSSEAVRDFLLLILFTGLRKSEAAQLQWKNVDLRSGYFTIVDPKNHDDLTLPIPSPLVAMFKYRFKNKLNDYVFPGHGPKKFLVTPRKQMLRVSAASGVKFGLHDLRRTFATMADRIEISGYGLKLLLNHRAKPDVTGGYVITSPYRLEELLERIAKAMLRFSKLKSTQLKTKCHWVC